jgi:hypothetical protein
MPDIGSETMLHHQVHQVVSHHRSGEGNLQPLPFSHEVIRLLEPDIAVFL